MATTIKRGNRTARTGSEKTGETTTPRAIKEPNRTMFNAFSFVIFMMMTFVVVDVSRYKWIQ